MSRGVDITQLDLFPAKAGPDGFRRQLFSFTCAKYPPWEHPANKTLIYIRPDQVELIDKISATWLNAKLDFQSTQESVKTSLSASVDVDLSAVKGGFSASASYTEGRNFILKQKRSTLTVNIITLIKL